ncbi:MAG TPA: CHAT domain-containing tetratricopeptide repeat protein [Pyrinomonadaceae bacterium]|nr:CHAT domain-containing tetratricopeptide repeat protein [Pyrinomonadaceae bacterium]
MERAELAAQLVAAGGTAQIVSLLREHPALADVTLAYTLKDICLDAWSTEPARATAAAAALRVLADQTGDDEIRALAEWGAGLSALVGGQMESAIARLDDSAARFLSLDKPHTAAATQVGKLIALAMLGRYDEAVECGLRARTVFVAHDDQMAAGKIEHNIGNIYARRDRYEESEKFQRAARERFVALDDQTQLAKIDNCLAFIHSLQHKFRSAEQLYEQALQRAEATGLHVTQAEIEASMGNLALYQGRYDRALDYLERSRRKYAALGMAHQSAIAEQEIADAYLELNLAPEAAAVYQRVTHTFADLGMRAEQARALAHHGRALILLGETGKAHALLEQARALYAAEGNAVGEASVRLTEAQLHQAEGNYADAARAAAEAEIPLAAAGTWRRLLLARWLRGEAARALGHTAEARAILTSTLKDAADQTQPQVAERCHTSLGLVAASEGDAAAAESSFKRAVELIESLRAPLPAEEFRTAFFADKLVPYNELVRLCLADGGEARAVEALCYVERARSRALVEMLGGAGLESQAQPRDPFEAQSLTRLEELREELNWFYSRINRTSPHEGAQRSAQEMRALHEAVREREHATLEMMRQLQHRGDGALALTRVEPLDIAQLQKDLGAETALVEYTSLDGELLAFVVTGETFEVVRGLGTEQEVEATLGQLRFQIDALRYGAGRMRKHLPHLTARTRTHLHALYQLLLRPVLAQTRAPRLLIVPHRALHYVPFHALDDGESYVVERREVCYAPSASVLRHCLARPARPHGRALLLGVPDAQTPRVRDEIQTLAPLFPDAVALLDEDATLAALRERAHAADVLHLACHGQFRPDNPLFSSLRLSGGWLTVRDAASLDLRHCGLVTLSACETGVSAVAPGDEIIGLARGFFSAGAPTLLLSLWTVDDEATARLMSHFYTRLRAGDSPAAALRAAQLRQLKEQPHPFFWSPFVLLGRW